MWEVGREEAHENGKCSTLLDREQVDIGPKLREAVLHVLAHGDLEVHEELQHSDDLLTVEKAEVFGVNLEQAAEFAVVVLVEVHHAHDVQQSRGQLFREHGP